MTTQDFLVKDYELKIRYLSDHFSRMWNRFNYFVAIESALISGKFVLGNGKLTQGVAIVGTVLALVWYIMGAEDRYLVLVYRTHWRHARRWLERPLSQQPVYLPGLTDDDWMMGFWYNYEVSR
jgi:hypothetical protein